MARPQFSIANLLVAATVFAIYFAIQYGEPKWAISNLAFVWGSLAANAAFFCLIGYVLLQLVGKLRYVAPAVALAFILNSGYHLVYAIEYTAYKDTGPLCEWLSSVGLAKNGPVWIVLNVWVTE